MLLSNFRRSFARGYGPSAITWWSWLITLPFALTVMSGLQYVTGGPVAVLAVSGLQHAILGGVLLLGAAVLRVVHGPARPVVVFGVFALIGAARPVLFLEAGGLLSIPVRAGELGGRIAINVVVMVVALGLIAVGVDLVREHRAVFRRLREAQRASSVDVGCAAERLKTLRASAVDEVVGALEAAATEAAATPLEPAEAARLLRALAEEVVRPASHRVYAADGLDAVPEAELPGVREWSASVFGGMRAAPTIVTALVFSAMVVPFGLVLFGVSSLVPVAVGVVVLLAGNAVIARLRLPRRATPRVLILLVSYGILGTLLTAIGGPVLTVMGGTQTTSLWFQAAMYPVVALGVAFVGSLAIRTRHDRAELEEALRVNVGTAARIRAEFEHERTSLARLLHAGVQSELIAGALAVTASATGGSEDTSSRIAEVVGRARDALRGAQPEPGAQQQLEALLESWSSAIGLEARIGGDVWDRLRDEVRASAVADAVSEGLANAVRHGDGSPISLELRPAGRDGVEVVIVSGGALVTAQPGIGLRQLAERGTVALREASGRVELAVAIP